MVNDIHAKSERLARLTRTDLERNGYRVLRSARSKGTVDLAAFNREHVLLVRIKAGQVTPVDRRKLAAFPAPPNVLKQFWVRTSNGWNIYDVPAEPA